MSKNIFQVYTTNPITSNLSTDLMYFGRSPYGTGDDAGMTFANFAAQFGTPYTASPLTKTDDTNVTLTLGGSPSTALLNATSLILGWTGTLGVTRGGTGLGTITQGDILFGSASNVISSLAKNVTATRYLSNTGTSNNPAWGQVNLSNGVTGNLPVTNLNSGTGASATTFWRGDGTWVTPTGTGVTSVSGTLNRITSSGGTTPVIDIASTYVGQTSITTLGTIATGTWNGTTVGVTFGGTGLNTVAQGDILFGSASNVISSLAKNVTATRYLSNTGTANSPAWAQVNLANGVTGNLPVTNLNSGTAASATTFWRGDGTWVTPAGTGFSQIVNQVFTSGGTYTPTAGMKFVIAYIVGGGGGGGGATTVGGSQGVGSGGGSGAYAMKVISAATIGASQTITIGAAGAAGTAGGTGGTGGTTSLGAIITAGPGVGGGPLNSSAIGSVVGGAGGTATGGDVNISGQAGEPATVVLASSSAYIGGSGASSPGGLGLGGIKPRYMSATASNGSAGTGFGAGGSGGACSGVPSAVGGAGTAGICIITEYI